MSAVFELHDSELIEVAADEAGLCLVFSAYVHRSEGRAGLDPGTGWSGIVHVLLADGRVTSCEPALPFEISGGHLEAREDVVFENCIELPFSSEGRVALHLVSFFGQEFAAEGRSVRVRVVGDLKYVEEFPGAG